MIGAAFPRASWTRETEAVYTMALASAGITPSVARAGIAKLITEEYELPPVALVIRECRKQTHVDYDWRCPRCGSLSTAGQMSGPGVCFECGWEGRFA
jgi:hypothetical protein